MTAEPQVVVADQREHAAEELERLRRAPPGTPAGSRARTPPRTPRPRSTAASEQMHLRRAAREQRPAPRPSRPRASIPGSCTSGTNTSPTSPSAAPALAHVAADLPLRDLRAVLVDQPLPDPPRRVTLLARRLAIRHQATRRSPPDTRPASAPAGPPAPASRGGTGDSSACLTARRCTPCRSASALIDSPSRS